jgi:hypothetical protein
MIVELYFDLLLVLDINDSCYLSLCFMYEVGNVHNILESTRG